MVKTCRTYRLSPQEVLLIDRYSKKIGKNHTEVLSWCIRKNLTHPIELLRYEAQDALRRLHALQLIIEALEAQEQKKETKEVVE